MLRPHSLYVTICEKCGEEAQSETDDVKCKNCGLEFHIDWPILEKDKRACR